MSRHGCGPLDYAIEKVALEVNLMNENQVFVRGKGRNGQLIMIDWCPFCGAKLNAPATPRAETER